MSLRSEIKDQIQNWGRLQKIVKVAVKHGFAGIFKEIGLPFSIPDPTNEENNAASAPARLRLVLQELGPTYIKFGQILSTRPDILPEAFVKEMEKLTDRIPSFPFEQALRIIEEELGRPPFEVFEWIEDKPIAAASISQVHRARLKGSEEPEVVIKVQRPNILGDIQSDIQILYFLAKSVEKVRPDYKLFNFTGMVREFQRSIHEELDFSLEAKNIEDISKSVDHHEGVVIPKVNWAFSTKKVLCMTEIKGITLSQVTHFSEELDRPFLAQSIAEFFLETIFFHGLFHCDAHAGNLILISEGKGQVGLVDFGMVGRIGPDLRDKMGRIFLALVNRDFQSLAQLYTEVAKFQKRFSLRDFKSDLEQMLGPNLDRPLSEVDMTALMQDSIRMARKYQIQLPRDLILFYRAAVTLEHVGRILDPQFTFLNVGSKFAKRLIQNRLKVDNLSRDIYRTLEGLRSLGTEVPTQLKSLLSKLDSENIFSLGDEFSAGLKTFRKSNQLLSLSIFLFGAFISTSLLTSFQPNHILIYPLWVLCALVGLVFGLFLLRR